MSKKQEMRELTIYYCNVCGNECGLPYRGMDDEGWGDCCSSKMYKAKRYLTAINTIRKRMFMIQIPETFKILKSIVIDGHITYPRK